MKLNLAPLVVTGVGVSAPIPTDSRAGSPTFGISCVVSAANVCTYEVQYTIDDVFAQGYNPATGNWTIVPAFPATTAATQQSSVSQFATAFRLNVLTSTGTVSIQIFQSDSMLGA